MQLIISILWILQIHQLVQQQVQQQVQNLDQVRQYSILINDNESNGDLEMDYFNLINAPLFYQKQFPDEDFSKLIEYDYDYDNNEQQQQQQQPTTTITIKNLSLVKQRILRIFISNLISIPKLNIPKLGTHRHPDCGII